MYGEFDIRESSRACMLKKVDVFEMRFATQVDHVYFLKAQLILPFNLALRTGLVVVPFGEILVGK